MIKSYYKIGSRRQHHKHYTKEDKYIKAYKKEVFRRGGKFKRNWRKILKSK